MMQWKHFDLAIEEGVATVTFNRPDKLNARHLRPTPTEGPDQRSSPDRGDTRVLVITGRARLCSGATWRRSSRSSSGSTGELEFTRMTGAVVKGATRVPISVIAGVNGIAAGAGSVIALAADLRILAVSSSFAFLFTKVGLAGADMGSAYLLPRIVGLGRASELLLLGDKIDAQTAHDIGLATKVVPDDELGGRDDGARQRLATGPAFAYATTKTLLTRELDPDLGSAIELEAITQALLMNRTTSPSSIRRGARGENPIGEDDEQDHQPIRTTAAAWLQPHSWPEHGLSGRTDGLGETLPSSSTTRPRTC